MSVNIRKLCANLQPRQKVLAIVGAAALLLAAVNFLAADGEPDSHQVSSAAVQARSSPAVSQPVMPRGFRREAVLKDPFAVPAAYQRPALPAGDSAGQPVNTARQAAAAGPQTTVPPVLTGVVAGKSKRLAILEYQSESRSYQAGEQVGPFLLAAVLDHSVILTGADGTLTLTLGR